MRWHDLAAAPLRDRSAFTGLPDDRLRTALAARTTTAPPVLAFARTALIEALNCVAGAELERGGLLLGEPFTDAHGAIELVHIRAAVASDDAESSAISLRMSARVWAAAQARLAPHERVVGWFHSHPGIGAFFSATDRATQAGFFRELYSIGWVIDPQRDPPRGEHAWFLGPDSVEVGIDAVVLLADTERNGSNISA
jgi:proteasome lid subunit RPN8/RPN11